MATANSAKRKPKSKKTKRRKLTLEEENKLLRRLVLMVLIEKGVEISHHTKHSVRHLAKELKLPEEGALLLAQTLSIQAMKEVFTSKGGH